MCNSARYKPLCDYAMCSIVYLLLSHDAGHQLKPDVRKQNMYARADKILPRKVFDWQIRSQFVYFIFNTKCRKMITDNSLLNRPCKFKMHSTAG